jgi:hypothetical protein
VARYGLHDVDASMEALADLTRHGSAEFAIRRIVLQRGHPCRPGQARPRAFAGQPPDMFVRMLRPTHAFQGFALAEYVARYGLHDVDASMEALADLTRQPGSAPCSASAICRTRAMTDSASSP